MLKGLIQNFTKNKKPETKIHDEPIIISRAEHGISRRDIHPNALKVLNRLHEAGFTAHLVGGCVRDLLLGKHPKDFDIATDALPEEIRKLFRNCRLIGKRFRLAHILFGKEIVEVATFRSHHKEGHEQHGHSRDGMIVRDNVYGSREDDVHRRDFSINALYYDIADFSIIDYTSGMEDLRNHCLRMIGDPAQRFHEDPVRLLRALRFVGKLDLNVHPETEKPLRELGHLLRNVSSARLFQEVLKFFHEGKTFNTFRLLKEYNVFVELFPETDKTLADPLGEKLLEEALKNADLRMQEGKTVSPAFILATFLWRPVMLLVKHFQEEMKMPFHLSYDKAIKQILRKQTEVLAIPRVLQVAIQEIIFLQYRLNLRHGSAPLRLVDHPRFRAAYDLLILRQAAGEDIQELCTWWTQFASANVAEREILIKAVSKGMPKRRRRPHKPRPQKKESHPQS